VAATGSGLGGPIGVRHSGETRTHPAVRHGPPTTPRPTARPGPRRHPETPSAGKSDQKPREKKKKRKPENHPGAGPAAPDGKATRHRNGPPDKIKVGGRPGGV